MAQAQFIWVTPMVTAMAPAMVATTVPLPAVRVKGRAAEVEVFRVV